MPSAVLVKELDPLKTGTCATGLTLSFTSFMMGGPGRLIPAIHLAYFLPKLSGLLGKAPKPGRHLCIACEHEEGLGA